MKKMFLSAALLLCLGADAMGPVEVYKDVYIAGGPKLLDNASGDEVIEAARTLVWEINNAGLDEEMASELDELQGIIAGPAGAHMVKPLRRIQGELWCHTNMDANADVVIQELFRSYNITDPVKINRCNKILASFAGLPKVYCGQGVVLSAGRDVLNAMLAGYTFGYPWNIR